EVEDLPDGEALALEAVGLDPAVGHAEGELIGIADAILTGEAVVPPQAAIAEAGLAGVEDRNLILFLVGNIEIEQARLQGLAEVPAEQAGVAIEVQTGVQAGNGQTALRCVVEVGAARQRGEAALI